MFEETIESKKFLNGSDEDKCKACFPRYFRAERSRTKSYDKQYMGQRRRTDADNIKPTPYFLPPPSHPRDEEIGPKRNKHRGRMKIEKKKEKKTLLKDASFTTSVLVKSYRNFDNFEQLQGP